MSANTNEASGPESEGTDHVAQPSTRAATVLLVAATVALAAVALLWGYGPIPVRVEGSLMIVPRDTTVAALMGRGLLSQPRGDLVSVSGRVLQAGSGAPPVVLVDGGGRGPDIALEPGARLTTVRGADVVEPTAVRSIETTSGVRYAGSGPVESVEDTGVPDVVEVVVGTVSGEEVSRRQVSVGVPMTIRREPAWPGPKRVALTFDDGPWKGSTDAILRQLVAAEVKGTFFVIGARLKGGGAAIARRVVAAGMEIGDHSQNHTLLGHAPKGVVRQQILRGARAVQSVLGVKPIWFRPPGGSTSATVRREAKRAHLRVAMWTIDPRDWERPPARTIARHILDRIKPGSGVGVHDGGGGRAQ
jgi:peptidoglycan/xylan/chitin deacetylase (PgdA/CDA1 family)